MSAFKVGDWVRWNSQAQGYAAHKRGVIVAVVPPRAIPRDVGKPVKGCGLGGRNEESYVVNVGKYRERLMWPRTVHLVLDNPEPARDLIREAEERGARWALESQSFDPSCESEAEAAARIVAARHEKEPHDAS